MTFPKLIPDVKDRWVLALRSGDYTQGRGVLCQVDDAGTPCFWCCLGVLADQLEFPYEWNEAEGFRMYGAPGFTETFVGLLPGQVANLVLENGSRAELETLMDRLVSLNDVEKLTFDEIADWVEENL